MTPTEREAALMAYMRQCEEGPDGQREGIVTRTRIIADDLGWTIPETAVTLVALMEAGRVVRVLRKGPGQFTALWKVSDSEVASWRTP